MTCVVTDRDGERGVAIADKVDVGTVVEEVVEYYQIIVFTCIIEPLV